MGQDDDMLFSLFRFHIKMSLTQESLAKRAPVLSALEAKR